MKANLVAIKFLVLFTVIFAVPFFIIWQNNLSGNFFDSDLIFVNLFTPLAGTIIGIIIHELIHGIFFAMYARKGFKSVKFGILWKMLTPYCHCKEPLKIRHYIIALLAPFIILGIIPGIISLFTGNLILLLFGIVFSGAAAGD